MPLDLNPALVTMLCIRMAIRLVPLATLGGRPKKISMGKVRSDPPPAKVLITPVTIPITNSNNSSISIKINQAI